MSVTLLGKITLSEVKRHTCTCDDCGTNLNDRFGDPRIEIMTYIDNKYKSSRWVCEACADELFEEKEADSIFD